MKNVVRYICLIALGSIFLPVGAWINNQMIVNPYNMPPVFFVNLVCLVIWMNIAFFVKKGDVETKHIIITMHVIPLVVLLCASYLQYIAKSFAIEPWGQLTQLYYMPLIWLKLPIGGMSIVSVYAGAFLTLVLCCFIGCRAKDFWNDFKDSIS